MKHIRSTSGRRFTRSLLATLRQGQTVETGPASESHWHSARLESRRTVACDLGQVYELFGQANAADERHLSHLRVNLAGGWFRSVRRTTVFDDRADFTYFGLDHGMYELEPSQPPVARFHGEAIVAAEATGEPNSTSRLVPNSALPLSQSDQLTLGSGSVDWALNAS